MNILPYIYEPDRSITVYKETVNFLDEHATIKEKIQNLGWVYHSVGEIIPQTMENFWSGHYFPYLESWEELQVSFTCVLFGLYKQAYVSLRGGLELGLLSVYYNINDEGHKAVEDWYMSKESFDANTPRTDKIWKILLSNNNIKTFDDKFDLKDRFNKLSFLHNYVHTKGRKYSNSLGGSKGNSQFFVKEALNSWLTAYEQVVTFITVLHLLKYPLAVIRFDYNKKFGIDMPSFGGLAEQKNESIKNIIPADYMEEIELIAAKDPKTIETLVEIATLPDMTPEQVNDQIVASYKISIEHGEGFIRWEEDLYKLYRELFKIEMDEQTKNNIEICRSWATENNFMESKAVRFGWNIEKG